MLNTKQFGLIGGVLLTIILMMMPAPEGLTPVGWKVLVIALWMGIWWLTEAVPIAVTSLIPLVVIPLMEISSINEVGTAYASKAIFLTLGGFILGVALERWQLHLRLALHTVNLVGTQPRRVVAGFMLACAFTSMWITNTASTVIMLPIAISVAKLLLQEGSGSDKEKASFGTALMLGLAFSASIGGMMTLVGTSTNVVFKGFFEETYGVQIDFLDWMLIGVPLGIVLLFVTWILLCFIIYPCRIGEHEGIKNIIRQRIADLGKMSRGERSTLAVFAFTAFLWIAKDVLNPMLPVKFNDASIAMLGAVLLFVVPANWKENEMLLDWGHTKEVPWGILLLLGGGISMAGLMNDHGVATWLGSKMDGLSSLPLFPLMLVTILFIISVTSMMSNVAVITAFLPVIAAVTIGFGENPLLLAVPATLAASCSFMFPVSTPPNAIVFGSNMVTIPQMAKSGFWLNLISAVILCVASYLLVTVVFDIQLGVLPEWAK